MAKNQNKKDAIEQYINTIVGATVRTQALAVSVGCSLPTVLAYIKENAHRFEKVKHGSYTILPASVTSITSTSTNTQFEW